MSKRLEDRKLGDEWADWTGDLDSYEGVLDEGKGIFLAFSTMALLFTIGLAGLFWYLAKPRLYQFGEVVGDSLGLLLMVAMVGAILWFLLITVSILFERKTFLPFYKANESMIIYLVNRATWLGGKFGISKDRMGSSFISVNNALVRVFSRSKYQRRLLILLPRCLSKEVRERTMAVCERYGAPAFIAGGGDVARKMVTDFRPNAIIGVACERDLVSGIRDVAKDIPVIAIANKRPEGPCKNTYINFQELEDALDFFLLGKPMEEVPEGMPVKGRAKGRMAESAGA